MKNPFQQPKVSPSAYEAIRRFVYDEAGIDLGECKQQLVFSRLNKRLRYHELTDFDVYAKRIIEDRDGSERRIVIDLMTTNETYFFREPSHLDHLQSTVLPAHPQGRPFRAWSAACSSGEEAYSIAMILEDYFSRRLQWDVFGSDISRSMIEKARSAIYPMARISAIPSDYLRRYCIEGKGEHDGFLLIENNIRDRVRFQEVNLIRPLPTTGDPFDVIFLRNVLIYFDPETRGKIVRKLVDRLKQGGTLYLGHSETIKGMDLPLELIAPTTYRKT